MTSPQRASSSRSARTPVAAAAARHGGEGAGMQPLGAPAIELAAGRPAAASNEPAALPSEGWGERAAREQLRWQLASAQAAVRSLHQLGAAQIELGRQLQESLDGIAARLQQARGLDEITAVQASLAQADAEGVLRHASRLAQLQAEALMQLLQEASSGFGRLHGACWAGLLNWLRVQTQTGGSSEMIEAEVEHVLSPMAASPLLWPAQEATRQAAQMAANNWNDWLAWNGQLANAGRTLLDGGKGGAH